MCVKKFGMKNALTAAIIASLLLFSTIAAAAPEAAGSPDSPGNSGSHGPDTIPPGLDKEDKEKDKDKDKEDKDK